MAKFDKKIKAFALRRKGKSVRDIARILQVSKGSVSVWCRDITLTASQREILRRKQIASGQKGRLLGTEANKQKRISAVSQAAHLAKMEMRSLSDRDKLMVASSLYWAEGSKTGPKFVFVNSDPAMIRLVYIFLLTHIKIPRSEIRITIQINEMHRKRIKKVLLFWSKLLDIPLHQFGNPYYIKTKTSKVYENYEMYHGVVRLRVLRSSGLQYRMLGYISALKEDLLT